MNAQTNKTYRRGGGNTLNRGTSRTHEDDGNLIPQSSAVAHQQDLDSSNVIYDDDFEIEEEKNNY